ncbi:hypothetical protein PABG_11184 [Paracoccidioides brasiliensis Pb03]|nr:hypothetical protein PABG_11184 [Paracoccidioides brasiliensis Pb03]
MSKMNGDTRMCHLISFMLVTSLGPSKICRDYWNNATLMIRSFSPQPATPIADNGYHSCLKPGGWVEFQDWDAMMQSADGTGKGSYIEQYITRTLAAFEKAGYIVRPGIFLEKWMKDTGFVNVKVTKFIVPLGAWAKDKHYFEQTLEASAMAALTRIENWTKEEVDFLIAKTKNDARNPKIHSEFHFYVVRGQKPE